MDIAYYVGLGVAIGSALGGASAALVKIRREKYSQARDEFKILIEEYKRDRDQKEFRIAELEQSVDCCKEEHNNEKMKTFRLEQKVAYLEEQVNILKGRQS